MLKPLLFLPDYFLLDLLSGSSLLFGKISIFLVDSVLLLVLDHLLEGTVLQVLLLFLHLEHVLLFTLFLLNVLNIPLYLLFKTFFLTFNILLQLFLNCSILLLSDLFFFLFLSKPFHFLLLRLHISLLLSHNVFGSLLCFINLLPCLYTITLDT